MPFEDIECIQTYRGYLPGRRCLDPKDAPADIFIERNHVSSSPEVSREHRYLKVVDRPKRDRDPFPREPRRSSISANRLRREMMRGGTGRYRYESSDSDSDSDTDGSSPRRIRSRKHYLKDLPVARVEPIHTNRPNRSRSMGPPRSRSQGPPGHATRYDSESDSSSSDDARGKKVEPKPTPKKILYTGLACVATIAAANNIYQSTKAHYTRQKELEEREISKTEAEKMKAQARKMDLISLGIAAVGAYNVRNGWKRAEGHWKAHRELQSEGRR